MPITDYRAVEAVAVAPVAFYKFRALWNRLRHRNTVEGHRVLGD